MPDYVQARPWTEIAAFYADCATRIPYTREMELLVRRIAASPYAGALHAAPSHIDLLVAPRPQFEPGKETLRVTPHPEGIAFEYSGGPAMPKPAWAKTVPVAAAFETLEHFLVDVARWYRP